MFIILIYSLRHKTHQLLLSAFQHKEAGEGVLARACRGRTSAKVFKRKEGRFISNVRKTLHCEGGETVEQAPGGVVEAPFLVALKAKLDWALSSLI